MLTKVYQFECVACRRFASHNHELQTFEILESRVPKSYDPCHLSLQGRSMKNDMQRWIGFRPDPEEPLGDVSNRAQAVAACMLQAGVFTGNFVEMYVESPLVERIPKSQTHSQKIHEALHVKPWLPKTPNPKPSLHSEPRRSRLRRL